MSTGRFIKVTHGDVKKRITIPNQYDFNQFKSTICERMGISETDSVAIYAKYRDDDDDSNLISCDADLEDNLEDIEALRIKIQCMQVEQFSTELVLDGESYDLSRLPGAESIIVQRYSEEAGGVSGIMELCTRFGHIGRSANTAYLASLADDDVEMQCKTSDLTFATIELCNDVSKTMGTYILSSSELVDRFFITMEYFKDNDIARALRSLITLQGSIQKCSEASNYMIEKVDKFSKGDWKGAELLGVKKEILDHRAEAKSKASGWCGEVEVKKREFELVSARKIPSPASESAVPSVVKSVAAGVIGLAAMAFAPPLHPLFAASHIAAGLLSDETGNARQERQQLEEEHERKKIELGIALERLKQERNKACKVTAALSLLSANLLVLKSALEFTKSFFTGLIDQFEILEKSEKSVIADLSSEAFDMRLLEARGFKTELFRYLARWVALKEMSTNARNQLRAITGEIQDEMMKTTSQKEAQGKLDFEIQQLIADHKK